MGISATLQELAVSTERGGTAMTKILMKMKYNTADFAKVNYEDLIIIKTDL